MTWWRNKSYKPILLLTALATGVLYTIFLVRGLLISIILSILITYLLAPLVKVMENKGMPRTGGILLSYLALLIIVAAVIMYGFPRVVSQLQALEVATPFYVEQALATINAMHERYLELGLPGEVRGVTDEWIYRLEDNVIQLVRTALATILGAVGGVFAILLAPVISFYLLKDKEQFKRYFINALPVEWRSGASYLLKEIDGVLGSFIRGYLLVGVVVGTLTTVALAVLGVDFALMLGIFAGLTELIPYFGPLIGAVPAVILATLKAGWLLGVKVIVVFIIIQQLESALISPKILGDRVGLHPLVIIISLIVGGKLFGLAGLLLAVPVAAVIKVVLKHLLRSRAISDAP